MKLSITQDRLQKALSLVGGAVHPRSTLPVLGNVLLQAGDSLRISATNLEVGVNLQIPATVETPGGITLPYKLLSEFVNSLPVDVLHIETDETTQTAAIKCGKTKAKIKGINAEEFPLLRGADTLDAITVPSQVLRTMIDAVAFAAATDESRPTLNGIETRLSSGRLTMAATDGYRLSVMATDVAAEGDAFAIIPAASLRFVAKFLTDEGDVDIAIDETQIHITAQDGDAEISSSIIGSKYPDYSAIIPKTSSVNTNVTVKRDAMQRAVKTAQLFARDNSNIVHLIATPDTLTLQATSAESGDTANAIDATSNGEIDIAINARYLSDMLAATSADSLTLQFTQPNRPMKVEVGDWLHVTMPMFTERGNR